MMKQRRQLWWNLGSLSQSNQSSSPEMKTLRSDREKKDQPEEFSHSLSPSFFLSLSVLRGNEKAEIFYTVINNAPRLYSNTLRLNDVNSNGVTWLMDV